MPVLVKDQKRLNGWMRWYVKIDKDRRCLQRKNEDKVDFGSVITEGRSISTSLSPPVCFCLLSGSLFLDSAWPLGFLLAGFSKKTKMKERGKTQWLKAWCLAEVKAMLNSCGVKNEKRGKEKLWSDDEWEDESERGCFGKQDEEGGAFETTCSLRHDSDKMTSLGTWLRRATLSCAVTPSHLKES